MTLSENEDDEKRSYCRSEPLCLFCQPYDVPECLCDLQTYIATDEEEKNILESEKPKMEVKWKYVAKKGKQDMWLRRRTEMKMKRRRRLLDWDRYLKSYLLMSIEPEGLQEEYVPDVIGDLETVKDAWPPNKCCTIERYIDGQITEGSSRKSEPFQKMERSEKLDHIPQVVLPMLDIRRSSVPENIMRKCSLRKSSEESEVNESMPDRTTATSSEVTFKNSIESARRKAMREKFDRDAEANYRRDMKEQAYGEELQLKKEKDYESNKFFKNITNLNESLKVSVNCLLSNNEEKSDEITKRATQNEYDKQGKGIIRQKTKEKGSQTGRFSCRSETTPSAKEDTEESRTGRSGSLPSSSPVEIPRSTGEGLSTSGNLSSESEDIKCTCFELISSKDTSTDFFNSGNSTLSQTVSQKSLSTQDSTVSINSVSTGGSSTSANSNSTSSDNFGKTSAKETTSEPTSRGRRRLVHSLIKTRRNTQCTFKRKYSKFHRKRSYCVRHYRSSSEEVFKMIIEDNELRDCNSVRENIKTVGESGSLKLKTEGKKNFNGPQEKLEEERRLKEYNNTFTSPKYKWAQCTPEEMYMMQRMRHRKFVQNYRRFSIPLQTARDTESLNACAANGSSYKPQDDAENNILIPRYSALPRTLSMLVNTSSDETSAHNSDSDSLSLADSLEEFPVTHVHHIFHDTKKELKPVRGDVNFLPENKRKIVREHPRPRAFFISIKEPYGEDELLSSIEKIPEPPNSIKDRINKRQLKIMTRRKAKMEKDKEEKIKENKKRKTKDKNDALTRTRPHVKMKEGKILRRSLSEDTENKKEVSHVKKERDVTDQKCKMINAIGKRLETKINQDYLTSRMSTCEATTSTSTSSEKEISGPRKRKSKKEKELSKMNLDLEIKSRLQKTKDARPKSLQNTQDKRLPKVLENSEELEICRNPVKPHAVIHPSQVPFLESEFYRRNKQVMMNPNRTLKFRQRFEVIPEEKSSSLSSTEENRSRENFREASLSVGLLESNPTLPDNLNIKHIKEPLLRRYSFENVSNLIFAKLMTGSVQTIPAFHKIQSSSEPIIVLSPKEVNYEHSRKGRDALIAMNREDFNRLSKGWKNFYMLKENSDESDNNQEEKQDISTEILVEGKENQQVNHNESEQGAEDMKKEQCEEVKTSELFLVERPENNDLMCNNSKEDGTGCKESTKLQARTSETDLKMLQPKEGKKELNDNIKFHSSSIVLKPIKVTPKEKRKNLSLPEVRGASSVGGMNCQQPKNKNFNLILPKVSQKNSDYDGMDSDSTVYCQPPSFIVPRLAFDGSGDFPSDGTFSSSSSGTDEIDTKIANLPLKHVPLRKRGISQKMRFKREPNCDTARRDIQGYSGWSVTVAGPLELAKAAPELEMRLSFPANGCGPPQVSQSDSGFAEESWQNSSLKKSQRSAVVSATNIEQRWTVTVKNPNQGKTEGVKQKLNKTNLLPDLGQTPARNVKKVLKNHSLEGNSKNCLGKISIYWPKVVLAQDEWTEEGTNEELSVRGSAVPLEKKPRPQTMTEKDLTKGLTSRSNQTKR